MLRAAVDGGLAITCRTALVLGYQTTSPERLTNALPSVSYCLRAASSLSPASERLISLVARSVTDMANTTDPTPRWPFDQKSLAC